jgi:2-polyprenyl-3-methyl-5-hydroxy-6-metoxy-1,4-benzoquinol methylase
VNSVNVQAAAGQSSPLMKRQDRPHCAVCGSPGKLLYQNLTDDLFGIHGEFSYRQCNNKQCRLIWQDPMPVAEDLPKAYVNYYTHAEGRKGHGKIGRRLARFPAHLLNSLLLHLMGIRKQKKVLRYLGLQDTPPARMLEIGCGRGEKLCFFRSLGWHVTGQEIDPAAVAHVKAAHGFDVLYGELTSLGLQAEQFEAIVMNHVLEHVPDIHTILSECFRLLTIGGRLILATPNGAGLGHRKFGKNWRGLEPPRHLHIFAKNNLQTVLHRHGFRDISVQTTAARSPNIFEASYQLQEGVVACKDDPPPTAIYYKSLFLLYKEWVLRGKHSPLGEELLAWALK